MTAADQAGPAPAAAEPPFLERLQRCIEQRQADGQRLALLLFECGVIDRIDAEWGYAIGDAARARMIAGLRAEVLRPDDFAGELGRDEFACVLSIVDGPQLAQLAAEKSLRTLNAPLWLGEAEIFATPAVGIALFPDAANDAGMLLRQAKRACIAAAGLSGRIAVYEESQTGWNSSLAEEGRLRSAIADDALDLVFQPQFDLRFGQIMGLEAMLRWRDGDRALVPMRAAVAAAEAGGLVSKMISALLNRALRNCSEFRQRAGLDLRIAINLPARALLEPNMHEVVQRAVRTWSLRPGRLMLEIEDFSTLRDHAAAQAAVMHLNEFGVKLSLDDAHTSLSSLFWLASMPFDELKIDLSVAADWTGQARTESVLRSLIELAHTLKLDVVATGVPDEAAAARLQQLGCDFMQADYKAPPVDAEAFVAGFDG